MAYLPAYIQCANLNGQAWDFRVEFYGISKGLSPWWLPWLWRGAVLIDVAAVRRSLAQ